MIRYILLLLLLCLFACNDVEITPSAASDYVKEFEQEASNRGIKIKYKGLKIILQSPPLQHPYQAYYDPNKHTIFIDSTSEVWHNFPKETMAHELGHAVLDRPHDFSRLPNGMYKSVMGNHSSPEYSGWTHGNDFRKEYYYDELFNAATEPPYWGY